MFGKVVLHLDFETYSDLDLVATGLHIYARGRHTDLWCAAFAFNEEPVQLWLPGQTVPERLFNHIEKGGDVWAHNASFEQEICNNVATRKYGWPWIYPDQLTCTMAMAYAMGLPGTLEKAAAALGVKEQKDMEGSRLMKQMCRPRTIDPQSGQITWWNEADKVKRLSDYCVQDVHVERAIGRRMMKLSPYEKRVWLLDQKINSRGVTVDVPALMAATIMVEKEKDRLNREMRHVSHNQIATCQAVQQIKNFIKENSHLKDLDSLAKQDVVELLGQKDLPERCVRVLELRQEAGKATAAKLEPMLSGAGSTDHRLRGCFQYSGANTRRWAGRRVQLHNLKRPKISQDIINDVLTRLPKGMTSEEIDMLYGSPLSVLSDCVRGFIRSAADHYLLANDFNAIEARVLAWLSGEEPVLETFRKDQDVYKLAAAIIFGVSIQNVFEWQRQVGKVAILALGYGGGVGAFKTMAKGYGVSVAPALPALWARADQSEREWVLQSYEQNKKRYEPITQEEFVASDLIKTFWRKANPNIVSYWRGLEQAAMRAVLHPKEKVQCRSVSYLLNGSFLWCKLPSGGVICYPYPEIKSTTTPWGETKNALTYMAEDGQTKQWLRFKTYGGSLAENITQAVARDLLADAMLRLEDKGYPVVVHVHDEIVCEMLAGKGDLDEASKVMCELPVWAKGLPVKAGGWIGTRYRK